MRNIRNSKHREESTHVQNTINDFTDIDRRTCTVVVGFVYWRRIEERCKKPVVVYYMRFLRFFYIFLFFRFALQKHNHTLFYVVCY